MIDWYCGLAKTRKRIFAIECNAHRRTNNGHNYGVKDPFVDNTNSGITLFEYNSPSEGSGWVSDLYHISHSCNRKPGSTVINILLKTRNNLGNGRRNNGIADRIGPAEYDATN